MPPPAYSAPLLPTLGRWGNSYMKELEDADITSSSRPHKSLWQNSSTFLDINTDLRIAVLKYWHFNSQFDLNIAKQETIQAELH